MSCQLDAVGFLFYFLRRLSHYIFHVVKTLVAVFRARERRCRPLGTNNDFFRGPPNELPTGCSWLSFSSFFRRLSHDIFYAFKTLIAVFQARKRKAKKFNRLSTMPWAEFADIFGPQIIKFHQISIIFYG